LGAQLSIAKFINDWVFLSQNLTYFYLSNHTQWCASFTIFAMFISKKSITSNRFVSDRLKQLKHENCHIKSDMAKNMRK